MPGSSPVGGRVEPERPGAVIVVVAGVGAVEPEPDRAQLGGVHLRRPGMGADGREVVGVNAGELVARAVAESEALRVPLDREAGGMAGAGERGEIRVRGGVEVAVAE